MATPTNDKTKMGRRPSERISQHVLYGLLTYSAVTFAAFYLLGFNTPYWKNESMNAPMLTDLLLGLMAGMLAIALAAVVVAKVHSAKVSKGTAVVVNGIHTQKISIAITLLTVLILLGGFLLSSTAPMTINGESYSNWWGLKLSGTLITTSSVLLLFAIGAALFGATRYNRKEKKKA